MIVVTRLTQTCDACPSQWEGETDKGLFVYVRYRSGQLRIGLGDTPKEATWAAMVMPTLTRRLGGRYGNNIVD